MKYLFLSLALLCSGAVYAQKVYTLKECIALAQQKNIQVKLSDLQRRQQALQTEATKYQRLPEVTGSASQNFSFGRGLTSENTYVSRSTSTSSFSVGAGLPLFTGFRIPNMRKQAKLNLEAAVADLAKVREDLSLRVAQSYFEVLFRLQLIKVAKQQLDLSTYQLHRMETVLAAGKAAPIDVSEARNTMKQDELNLVENQNQYRMALLDLSQLLELPSPDSLQVVELATVTPPLGTDGPQTIYEGMIEQRPSIHALQKRLEASKVGIKIARAGYWPTLSLSAGLGTSYYKTSGISGIHFGKQMKDNFNRSIGINLSVPIFDRFTTRTNIRQAKLNVLTQMAQLDLEEKNLYKEIQTAWYNAVSSQKKMESARSAADVAEETFALMTKKYEYNKANATEYNEQKTKYINAVSNRISAEYDYLYRTKILDFYRGIPIE